MTDPYILTASILCREALMILRQARGGARGAWEWPTNALAVNPVEGLFGVVIYIGDDDILNGVEWFSDTHLIPAITAWGQTFRSEELGDQPMQLPLGVDAACNECLDGMAMRCVMVNNYPVREMPVPSRMGRYYDIGFDEWIEAPLSATVSFWVHTPDHEGPHG